MNNQSTTEHAPTQSATVNIISLVAGILALLCGLVAIISIPLGIAAIVLGVIGVNKGAGRGMGIAGIITGLVGVFIGLVSVLLIFLAVPALQQNQQDTAAKNDMGAAMSGVTAFRSNNQGALPTKAQFYSDDFKQQYLTDIQTSVEYNPGVSCDGSKNEGAYSLSAKLANGEYYCLD